MRIRYHNWPDGVAERRYTDGVRLPVPFSSPCIGGHWPGLWEERAVMCFGGLRW